MRRAAVAIAAALGWSVLATIAVPGVHPGSGARAHEVTDPGPALRSPFVQVAANPSWLRVRVVDEDGEPVPALVRAVRAGGGPILLDGTDVDGESLVRQVVVGSRWHRGSGWVAARGEVVLDVPATALTVEAFAGLHTERSRVLVQAPLVDTLDVELPLTSFGDPRDDGWIPANTHLHLRDLDRHEAARYLRAVARSNHLDLVFLDHLARKETSYVSNTFDAGDLAAMSGHGVRFALGAEHRHNFRINGEGYGHVLLLGLEQVLSPLSLGPSLTGAGTDGTPLRSVILAGKEAGATTVWAHNAYGKEHLVSWALGGLDALNLFDGLHRGDYDTIFYRLLNAGFRVPIATGTDWFVGDLSRVYARLDSADVAATGDDGPDPAAWLSALVAGRTFITNGPLLTLAVDDAGIGDTVALEGPGTVRVRASARGRAAFEGIELIRNGEVLTRALTGVEGGHHAVRLDTTIDVDGSCWFAVRATEGSRTAFTTPLFAHTSAVHVEVGGAPVFVPLDAQVLIALLRRVDLDEGEPTFAPGEREAIEALYEEARLALEARVRAPRDDRDVDTGR